MELNDKLKEFLGGSADLIQATETFLGVLMVTAIYLIINPSGLQWIVFEPNQAIRLIDLVMYGLPIYLIFRLVELSKPIYLFVTIYEFIKGKVKRQ